MTENKEMSSSEMAITKICNVAQVINYDVTEISLYSNDIERTFGIAANRMMMVLRTKSFIEDSRDVTQESVYFDLIQNSAKNTKDTIESIKRSYQPEFNISTGKPTTNDTRKDYKTIGNMVMLLSRAEKHIWTKQDMFPYEYIERLNNMSDHSDSMKLIERK